jgi:hypothetical protein
MKSMNFFCRIISVRAVAIAFLLLKITTAQAEDVSWVFQNSGFGDSATGEITTDGSMVVSGWFQPQC